MLIKEEEGDGVVVRSEGGGGGLSLPVTSLPI